MPLPVAIGTGIKIGGWLGGVLLGKRKRSSCRTISAEDVAGFRAGTVAVHVLGDRAEDIRIALNLPDHTAVWNLIGAGGYATMADIHMNTFVPLCTSMEGDNWTDDPNAGPGWEMYQSARAAFRDVVRSGRIPELAVPRGGGEALYNPQPAPGGGYGVPGGLPGPPAPGAPLAAGFGGGTGLLLGLGALLLFMGKK